MNDGRARLGPVLLDMAVNRDIVIVGEKGTGKSVFARYLSQVLGYSDAFHTVHLFRDMTSRDLLQRRATDEAGNTVWEYSPLVSCPVFLPSLGFGSFIHSPL